ncbi:MAG: NTP transferase domain-containing protein [Desulfobacteraceae bacterium]|nr:NTP transferase domain-containing protein [Desulfobacteraceae bacterium]
MSRLDDLAVIILAAGKGTRMKSDIAKVLHKVAGKSMVVHVAECALKIARNNVHVVVGHQAQSVKKEVTKYYQVDFALQEQLLGTGDAVKAAIPGLNYRVKDVLVLCGDVPLIQEDTLKNLVDGHKKSRAKVTVLATDVENPKGYGRIVLDSQHRMICIKEEADATENEKKIKKVNTGIYCFDKNFLTSVIEEIKPDNNQAEYYLTDVIEIAQKKHEKIEVVTMADYRQVIGVNRLEELAMAEDLIHQLGK